jgi:hypothetical protein
MRTAIEKLRPKAFKRLRSTPQSNVKRSDAICKFLILPSFGNPISWDVCSTWTKDGKVYRLYRTTWRYDIDTVAKPEPTRPTIETGCVELKSSELHSILALLTGTAILIYCDNHPFGCDGVSYELTMGNYFCFTTIHWWSELPREWAPLRKATKKLVDLFETTWKQCELPESL